MTTDTTEKGLELLIVCAMTGRTELLVPPHQATETSVPVAGGTGWLLGDAKHYDREHAVDLVQLRGFLRMTQEPLVEALGLESDGPTQRKFLDRLQGEISRRGVIDVLRKGVKHGPHNLDLFYGTPSPGNPAAAERYAQNRFSVTRQLRYSRDETQRALDLALFVNGLPVATFELKNSLTKQTVADAVEQYQRDREAREKLFEFGRCVVHFAVDDNEVRFCTHLKGKALLVPPLQPGLERRRGQPAESGRPQDRLPLEAHPHPCRPDGHPGELRSDRRAQGREDGEEEAEADLAALPPARRRAPAAGRCRAARRRAALPDPALGGQRQVELHRLAGPPAHRPGEGRRAGLRLDPRGHRPPHPRPADPRHHQGVRAGGRHDGARRALERPAEVHRERQEDHHHHGAEVPLHPRGDRQRAADAALRDPHRRGALEPGRKEHGGPLPGALRGGGGGGRRHHRRQDQPADGGAQAAAQRQLLRLHGHPQEQDAGDLRRSVRGGQGGQAPPLPRATR